MTVDTATTPLLEANSQIAVELFDAFGDIHDEIDALLPQLLQRSDVEKLNQIFRAIHNIKGNASLVGAPAIIRFAHALENVAESLRCQRYVLTSKLADCIQLSMDRLRDIHERELLNRKFGYLYEDEAIRFLNLVADADTEVVDCFAEQLIEILGAGVRIPENNPLVAIEEVDRHTIEKTVLANVPPQKEIVVDVKGDRKIVVNITNAKLSEDLMYYQELALQQDSQKQKWNQRSLILVDWAQKMNEISGVLVPPEQLAAAVYLHDIGLSFLTYDAMVKKDSFTTDELQEIQQHPRWGANMLSRIPGWEEAAEIVMQHHEYIDGSGFPMGLKSNDIHHGAKILAIIDEFFELINNDLDKSKRLLVVRAIAQVNACADTRFEGLWVQCFNQMIRKEVRTGSL
ncbi:MAG: hypothetical protein COA42_00705 [Alteromonadaceae bacterium]|nr:MAG: hypothetical protein COA42_00705 [Alteromonadaceae bacterium]